MSDAPRDDDPTSISASCEAASPQVGSPPSGLPVSSIPSGETGKSQARSPEVIEGVITRIKWPGIGHRAGEDIGAVVNGVTVIGACDAALRLGDRIQASGDRMRSSKWGPEYRVASIAALPPVQHDAQSRLLQLEGVTLQTARKLIDHFGPSLFHVLKNHPERLVEIPRLKAKTREKILSVAERFADEKLLNLLLRTGVPSKKALAIADKWPFAL